MKIIDANIGNWYVQCIPGDGARISSLKYHGYELLTTAPADFKCPATDYGEYETRPVYGYDDCFPTVERCLSPDGLLEYRDHGELCWLDWQVQIEGDKLICSTACPNPKATFKRILGFSGNKLTWRFELVNTSSKNLPFLHVMHPLLPLDQIQSIKLPGFRKVMDNINWAELDMKNARQVIDHLIDVQANRYEMLLLNGIDDGSVVLGFAHGINLHIDFDKELFPTLGIWWNNRGYPDEEGLKRNECAFEPIPGTCSNLGRSIREGSFLEVGPEKTINWEILWEIK